MSRRPRRNATQWQQLIDRQSQSGSSAAAFCRENGLTYASFMYWRSRLTGRENNVASSVSDTSPEFIELTDDLAGGRSAREDPSSTASLVIELDLGSGIQLRISRAH